MSRDRRRTTGPTNPMQIDYVVLVCRGCDECVRLDLDPPLVGGVQLRRWFSENARTCTCGNADWIVKAHVIGRPDVTR